MIRLPTSNSPTSRSQDNLPAGSGEIVDLGQHRMAAELAEARARVAPLEAEDQFQEWLGQEKLRFEEEKENQAPEMAEGFAERALTEFSERGKKFKETIAPEFHSAIDTKLSLQEEGLYVKAVGFERKAQKRAGENYLKAEIDRLSERAAKAAATLPADHPGKRIALAAIEERAARAIDQNPVLKPYEKQKEAARVRGALQKVFVENLSGEERSDLDQAGTIETLGARIRLLNDLAELDETDPDTAALGPDGFGREVWLREVRRQRPDVAEGKSNADLLALRGDPEFSTEIRDRAIEENATLLDEGGHEVTPATLYLAHLIGARGVAAMLDTDPNAAAAEIDPIGASDHPQLFYAGGDPDQPRPVSDILDVSEAATDGARLNDWRAMLDAVSPQLLTAIARHASVAAVRESIAASRAAYTEKLVETEGASGGSKIANADMDTGGGESDGGEQGAGSPYDGLLVNAAFDGAGFGGGTPNGIAGQALGGFDAVATEPEISAISPEATPSIGGAVEEYLRSQANDGGRDLVQLAQNLPATPGASASPPAAASVPMTQLPPGWPPQYAPIFATGLIDINKNIAEAKAMDEMASGFGSWAFIMAVKGRGPWDYKSNAAMMTAVKAGKFSYADLEDFGNFHFGYVAAAAQYRLMEAHMGAGFHQWANSKGWAETKERTIAFLGGILHSLGGETVDNLVGMSNDERAIALNSRGITWGDNADDILPIQRGYEQYFKDIGQPIRP